MSRRAHRPRRGRDAPARVGRRAGRHSEPGRPRPRRERRRAHRPAPGAGTPRLATDGALWVETLLAYVDRCVPQVVEIVDRAVRPLFRPPPRPRLKRPGTSRSGGPSRVHRLRDPPLHQAPRLLAMDRRRDVEQDMHMIGLRGAHANQPAAAVTDRRQRLLDEPPLVFAQPHRRVLQSWPNAFVAWRVGFDEWIAGAVLFTPNGWCGAIVQPRAVRPPRDMPCRHPRTERRIVHCREGIAREPGRPRPRRERRRAHRPRRGRDAPARVGRRAGRHSEPGRPRPRRERRRGHRPAPGAGRPGSRWTARGAAMRFRESASLRRRRRSRCGRRPCHRRRRA